MLDDALVPKKGQRKVMGVIVSILVVLDDALVHIVNEPCVIIKESQSLLCWTML